MAIAWLLHRPTVASVVIGARTAEQLEENMRAVQVQLSQEEVDTPSLSYISHLPFLSDLVILTHSSLIACIQWPNAVLTLTCPHSCLHVCPPDNLSLLSQMQLLNECSKETLPYPYEMVFRLQKGRERDI